MDALLTQLSFLISQDLGLFTIWVRLFGRNLGLFYPSTKRILIKYRSCEWGLEKSLFWVAFANMFLLSGLDTHPLKFAGFSPLQLQYWVSSHLSILVNVSVRWFSPHLTHRGVRQQYSELWRNRWHLFHCLIFLEWWNFHAHPDVIDVTNSG